MGVDDGSANLGIIGEFETELAEWDDNHVLIDESSECGSSECDGSLFYMSPPDSLESAQDNGEGILIAQLALPAGEYNIEVSLQGYVMNTVTGQSCSTQQEIATNGPPCTYQSVGQTFSFTVGELTCADVECSAGYGLVDGAASITQPSVSNPPWASIANHDFCCELLVDPLPVAGDSDRSDSIEGSASAFYSSIFPGEGHGTTTEGGLVSYTSSLPTVVELKVDLTAAEENVYSVFSLDASPMSLPAADASASGFWPDAVASSLTSAGMSLAGWSNSESFTVPEGSVYYTAADGPTGPAVTVATVSLPGSLPHTNAEPYYFSATLNVKGHASDGSEWYATGVVVTGSVPAVPGCPFDSKGVCADGSMGVCPDGIINTADLLNLLSSYSTCSASYGCDYPSETAPWHSVDGMNVGYPVDGFPQDGEGDGYGPGTWGDGIINVHDLLDLLGNFYRNYAEVPCA
jgi:hypothetical protein